MAKLLWTEEDYIRFTKHSSGKVRRWAVERLVNNYPESAAKTLVTLINDPDESTL